MEYYVMKHSIDLKVIGKFPQLEKMFDGFHMSRRYEAFGLHSEHRTTPMARLNGFQLKYHAKVTDWVSAAHFGPDTMLISKNLYDVLQRFRSMPSICIDSEVIHQKRTYHFKFIHFPEKQDQAVNFKLSRFYLIDAKGNIEDVDIWSEERYNVIKKEIEEWNKSARAEGAYEKMKNIRAHQIFINSETENFDFFRLAKTILGFIVSASLKQAIEEANMSGIKFISMFELDAYY